MGVVGLAENKANSAPIELELELSLAIYDGVLIIPSQMIALKSQ